MIDPDDTGDLKIDVGRRLYLARRAVDMHQAEFGDAAGMSQPQYSMVESGRRLLTLTYALQFCARFGLSLDWIYRGDPSGLPVRLVDAINKLRKQRTPTD